MNVVAATRSRCLAVAAGLTAALWGAAAVLVGWLTAGKPASVDDALVRLCGAALVAAVLWGWLQAMAGVADAWRGSAATAHAGAVRRLVLAACGAAVLGTLAAPAVSATPDRPRSHVLAGLPMPDRAVGPAHRPVRQVRPVRTVVVGSGDSLWTLARAELGAAATGRQLTERWHEVYRRNRAVIGPDPDLIRPGQVLRLPRPTKEQP